VFPRVRNQLDHNSGNCFWPVRSCAKFPRPACSRGRRTELLRIPFRISSQESEVGSCGSVLSPVLAYFW
jgi:hypothetical protein